MLLREARDDDTKPFTLTSDIDKEDEDPRCTHFSVRYEGESLYDGVIRVPVLDAEALRLFIRDCRQGIDVDVILHVEQFMCVRNNNFDDGLQPVSIEHALWYQRGVLKIGLYATDEDSCFVIPRSVHGEFLDFLETVASV